MSALPEVAQLLVAVVVVDVGEHLHDLSLFLFQTSDIQHKYSKFRDFQVIDTYRDIEYILIFLEKFQYQQLGKIVIYRVPYLQKRSSLHG